MKKKKIKKKKNNNKKNIWLKQFVKTLFFNKIFFCFVGLFKYFPPFFIYSYIPVTSMEYTHSPRRFFCSNKKHFITITLLNNFNIGYLLNVKYSYRLSSGR